jgi:hypothetical protein
LQDVVPLDACSVAVPLADEPSAANTVVKVDEKSAASVDHVHSESVAVHPAAVTAEQTILERTVPPSLTTMVSGAMGPQSPSRSSNVSV